MSVTKEFAVKIDTELSELHNQRWELLDKISLANDSLKFYQKHYSSRIEEISKCEGKIVILKDQLFKVGNEILTLDEVYNQDPWTRAFLVLASNGHVHSSLNCSTCFYSTRYNWLVQYSNDEENTIVEDAGSDACTICYPSAPADVLNRPSRIVTADKIAKAQAKAERDEKKVARIAKEKANAPTASGEFLTYTEGKWKRVIKTERSAIIEWADLQRTINREIVTHYYDGKAHSAESVLEQIDEMAHAQEIADLIAKNLSEKHGVSFDQELKILNNKYQKRRSV